MMSLPVPKICCRFHLIYFRAWFILHALVSFPCLWLGKHLLGGGPPAIRQPTDSIVVRIAQSPTIEAYLLLFNVYQARGMIHRHLSP